MDAAHISKRIVIGTLAFKDKEILKKLLEKLGSEKIVISVDHKDGKIVTHGWQKGTDIDLIDSIKDFLAMGFTEFLLTNVNRDGTLEGPDLEFLEKACNLNANVIASGGISNAKDVENVKEKNPFGVILGKALYENKISIEEATKRIIPCLDVKEGRVVKGLHFKSIKDAGDPVELAKQYSDEGADELVFLDITASEEKRETIKNLVRQVATVINIPFTVGGGVNSLEDARNILLNGADKVGINTGAVKNPKLLTELMEIFGRQCVVVAIDAKRNYEPKEDKNVFSENGKQFWFEVFIYGGKKETGLDAIEWAKQAQKLGAGEILLTSIDKDGTKDGYDIFLTREVVNSTSIPVIASGGCGKPDDMVEVFNESKVDAALAASIFHYQDHGVNGVKTYLKGKEIPVRL
jgi:cyclase